MPRLVIESGRNAGRSVEISKAAILGRAESADLRIADGKASREHCRVFQQAGSWVVVDLNSRNGIQVNGIKTTRKNLHDGDTIVIGETVIAFRGGAAASLAETPDVGQINIDLSGREKVPVVRPTRPAAGRPAAGKRASGAGKAKEAAFAAARADSAAASQAARAAPAKGIEVRDSVLQFSKIDARKASIFQTDLSQHGGMAKWVIWAAGLGFVALLMFLIIKLLGVTAG